MVMVMACGVLFPTMGVRGETWGAAHVHCNGQHATNAGDSSCCEGGGVKTAMPSASKRFETHSAVRSARITTSSAPWPKPPARPGPRTSHDQSTQ